MLCVQSTHMASGAVSEATVYACTGNPLPQDIEQIVQWLFNFPFAEAFDSASCLASLHAAEALQTHWA